MEVRNMKTIALSLAIAFVLILGGGIALQTAQAGNWMGNGGPMGMGAMPAHEGSAHFDPPTLPKIVERDLDSNCDRFYYLLHNGYYDAFYDRCKYGNSTQDYSVNYRSAFNFYASLELSATVGTDPAACATTSEIVVADGTTVYYCYTATNTGNIPLPLHTLEHSGAGIVFSNTQYILGAGQSVSSTLLGAEISDTVSVANVVSLQNDAITRSGVWTGFVQGGVSASASASTKVDVAAIKLAKTVGETAGACASTTVITLSGSVPDATYCYTAQNTGSTTLSVESLVDSELGPISNGVAVDIAPGDSYSKTETVSVTQSITNVGTVTATAGSVQVTGVATATVNLVAP